MGLKSSASFSTNGNGLLFVLRSADMTLTTDQVMTKLFSGTNYVITAMYGIRKTGAFGVVVD